MNPERRIVIAIDGPSGAGKSTVARALARRLGFLFLDTGAMYRAVALALRKRGVELGDETGVARLVDEVRIRFSADGERVHIQLGDGPEEDVTDAIRTPEVTSIVSQVSALPAVRSRMTALQRGVASGRSVVAEGRDTTTVVFPQADRKFFLTAKLEERARRRRSERPELASQSVEEVAAEIAARDARDSTRRLAPLVVAPDAVVIDTTGIGLDEVVLRLARECA
ncbi:MAG TPA: (d)CMP kinase [Planctomycetota bacterium]|nr:(d)CMP kinase [Planctomycetota bacterium]